MLAHAQESDPMWIDVRTASEFSDGHVEGAINIEFGDVVAALGQRKVATETAIILYCGSGKRSGFALESLRQAGYENLTNAGGLDQARTLKASQ
ncbi:rhodanese-like domain-containing protein [Halieaceae bacterium IMCC14734]|uniref:Rhodanese-like domain-containing protein n=2 Tax=Candidatus Litorirhabdus singularis TaxID=2518993 RepID=A0ABT3TKF8_9GAMM|nr:rhodanese-like domain-containing protein [Candidatus Litorirhabdus singularis]